MDEQTIIGVCKDGSAVYFIWLSRPHELNPLTPFTCCEDKKKRFDSKTKISGIEQYDRSIKKFDFPMAIMTQSKCVLRGGYWDGKLGVCPIDGHKQDNMSLQGHQGTITAMNTTLNERIVITGSK